MADHTATARLTPRSKVAVAGLVLATAGTALPLSMAAPTLSTTALLYGTTTADTTWVLTTTLIVATVSAPIIARLGDNHSPRRILLFVLPIVALGLFLAGTATSLTQLIFARALQGLSGGVLPLVLSLTQRIVPERRRTLWVGILASTFASGTALGAVLAGVLVNAYGTPALAWLPLTIVIAAQITLLAALPPTPASGRRRLHLRASLALGAGGVALLLAITEAPKLPHPIIVVALLTLGGVVALGGWARTQYRGGTPLWDRAALRRRTALATAHTMALLGGGSLFGTFVALPAFVEAADGLDLSIVIAGALLLPATAAIAVVGPLTGLLRRGLGRRGMALLGAVAGSGGAILQWVAPHEVPVLLAGSALLGAGVALTFAAALTVSIEHASADDVAGASAPNIVARQLGGALGAGAAGAVIAAAPPTTRFDTAFVLIAILSTGVVLAALGLPQRRARVRSTE
ncbi:MFS transporter [Microbacterium xanthum]|uniref:MFS transporter n=1 Tax=Microbacterium xanthum TaxID=3079794 RepID=UPI002AD41E24|nr:MFS transporter [Microbacterium sp. KSW-48]MDZ8172470.1 MFS transporter [Microbacterium sp. KSW-48]